MNLRMGAKIGLRKQIIDFLVLLASWYLFGSMARTLWENSALFPVWVILTSIISMTFLSATGYFSHHIPKPELYGGVSLLFTLPLSAFVAKWALVLSSFVPPIRYSEVLKASVAVAIVFEISQLVIFRIHRALGWKWTLVAHLDQDELAFLRKEVQDTGNSWWIDVKPETKVLSVDHLQGDETMVISRKAVRHLKDHPELLIAHLQGHPIVDVRQLVKEFHGRVPLQSIDAWTFLLSSTYQHFLIRFYFYAKELLEVLLAAALMILLSPLLIGLGVGIWMTSGRPILYRQKRLGYRGKQFDLYKFRTMRATAENTGPQWATRDDPRTSPFGKWLRKTRLDELPQLLNVIKGDLSFVGPRPERPEFYDILSEHIPLFTLRLLVRPGITGWAQVRQGYAASIEECKTKLEYDLYYVQHMSPGLDLHVLMNTAAMMIRGNSGR